MMKRLLVASALMVLMAANALAFGEEGHRIVCHIAFRFLSADQQAEVDRLTRVYRAPNGQTFERFEDGCIFPDSARGHAKDGDAGWQFFSRFNDWHFLNVSRDTKEIAAGDCANNCVLEGIEHHTDRLAKHDLEDWKRAEALFFLGHWVGDVHQPLHISFSDDLGGNSIKPILGGFYLSKNLHQVWDSGIIRKAMGADGWRTYADRLFDEISDADAADWRSTALLAWAQESYDVTTTHAVDYCEWQETADGEICVPENHTRTLRSAYQQQFRDVIERRMQQAGVRLAERIRKSLAE